MVDAVYIHIPFCEKKCLYCDFNSYALTGQSVLTYLQALDKEISYTVKKTPPASLKTIYIGGGTPTALTTKELEVLLRMINHYFPIRDKNVEYTIEVNPGTIDIEKLNILKEYGINRISMGVQAFQDDLLAFVGRIHTEKDIYQSIEYMRKTGFTNISIDLMFGLPNQTLEMLKESLTKALELNLNHYSIYGLKVEEKTAFYQMQKNNQLPLPNEDIELEMYLLTIDEMEKQGYSQYEISNFAIPGLESKHNMNYWKNHEYYGFGAGAHGFVDNLRYENMEGIKEYITSLKEDNHLARTEQYHVSFQENMENTIMLGLRMMKGISYVNFRKKFQIDIKEKYGKEIAKLLQRGLLQEVDNGICLTKKGIIYGNDVFSEFISL